MLTMTSRTFQRDVRICGKPMKFSIVFMTMVVVIIILLSLEFDLQNTTQIQSISTLLFCQALMPSHERPRRMHSSRSRIRYFQYQSSSTVIAAIELDDFANDDIEDIPVTDKENRKTRQRSLLGHQKFEITMNRRDLIISLAATSLLLPSSVAAADASASKGTSQTLEDMQFGQGRWNPVNEKPGENLATSSSTSTVKIYIPAYFVTYLTRFLLNYDSGIANWWNSQQHSYSLLSEDQQTNRLGRDFGSLAASIQQSITEYLATKNPQSQQQGYEEIFQRLVSSFVSQNHESYQSKEKIRHLCLLAATLPSDLQPKQTIQNLLAAGTKPTKSIIASADESEETTIAMQTDLTMLLPQQYQCLVASDGSLMIQPNPKFYEVGIGQEFGQAATATTFGPLSLNALSRELPDYSLDVYALFGISGATGCCLTHSLVIPLDVVKTKAQTNPEDLYTDNIISGANRILKEEGVSGLFTGAQATLAGYFWYGLSVYPSYAFFKRLLGLDMLPPDIAVAHATAIALVAGALASVIASLGLTPLEAARIRVVADPKRYKSLGLLGTLRTIASECDGDDALGSMKALYAGLPSLMTRQVIFGSVKFLAFERACEYIYLVWPSLRDATWTSLSVSLFAGAFSGALSSFVSQPADAVLTYVAAREKECGDVSSGKSLGVLEGSRLMVQESGFASLFRGLGSRSVWAAAIIAGQFLLYDVFRNYFGVTSEDLSQVFQISL